MRGRVKQDKGGSSDSKFVLMIGDEGAILVQTRHKKVVRRLFAQSPENTRAFNDALAAAPKAPLTLLIDLMDQSYIRQTLPPVSSLSVGKIAKRRMDKDFSPDDIKGFMILDREKTGRRDWNYMMVSLANPPLLQKWIAFAVERSNPFKGICLVPLESQPYIHALVKSLHKNKAKDVKPLEWQILISHHKVGGFRQVVLRGGKLVFTRLTQPIGEALPAVIAGNIEQEMINTLEYLKRLGLQDPASMCISIVVSGEIKQALDPQKAKAGEYYCFTPVEMAVALGIPDAAQQEDQFGDIVLCAFALKHGKLVLPLKTPYTQKLARLSKGIIGLRTIATVCLLSILAWIGMSASDIYNTLGDIDRLSSDKPPLQAKLNEVKAKIEDVPKQINFYADVVTLASWFDNRRFDALTFVQAMTQPLKDEFVRALSWTLNDPLGGTKPPDKRVYTADITLRIPTPTEPHDAYIAEATSLISRMEKAFSDAEVTHSELAGVLPDNKELKTTIGEVAAPPTHGEEAAKVNDDMKFTIKGPIEHPKTAPSGQMPSPPIPGGAR